MGHGSRRFPESITCAGDPARATAKNSSAAAVPTEATGDCNLGVHWALDSPYPQLSDARLTLDTWDPGRKITLRFFNQQLGVTNPQHATWDGTESDGSDTFAKFVLDDLGAEFLCKSGHFDETTGAFVRDTSCSGDSGHSAPFVKFQLQPGPDRPPEITCPEWDRVKNAEEENAPELLVNSPPWIWVAPSPAPPPPPRPAPRPPTLASVAANSACLAGGTAAVEHAMASGNSGRETWRIGVHPAYMWPTGYAYVVGLRGDRVTVDHTDDASMESIVSTTLEGADADYKVVFSPSPMGRKFAFNAYGARLVLTSLTCQLESPSPSPPLPASDSLTGATLTAASLGPSATRDAPAFAGSLDVQSVASPASISVVVLLAVLGFLVWQRSSMASRSLWRRVFGPWAKFPSSAVDDEPGAAEGGRVGVEMGRAADTDLGSDDEPADDYWSVILQLGGRELEAPPLAVACATSLAELKYELAALARRELGPAEMPTEWGRGDLTTMRVQYLTVQSRLATAKPSTDFALIYESRVLQVSRGGK